jgi:tetratricopeptide (TPR) repeat protein
LPRERKGGVASIGIILHQGAGDARKPLAESDTVTGPSCSGIKAPCPTNFQMRPNSIRGSYNRAVHQASRFSETATLYSEVLERFQDHPDTIELYGVLLHQIDHNEATAALLKRAVTARPESDELYNHLGVFRRALGDLEGPRQAFAAASSPQPSMAETIFNLATTLSQRGRCHEVEALKAVKLAPGNNPAPD